MLPASLPGRPPENGGAFYGPVVLGRYASFTTGYRPTSLRLGAATRCMTVRCIPMMGMAKRFPLGRADGSGRVSPANLSGPEARWLVAGGEARLGEREPPDNDPTTPEQGMRPGGTLEADDFTKDTAHHTRRDPSSASPHTRPDRTGCGAALLDSRRRLVLSPNRVRRR